MRATPRNLRRIQMLDMVRYLVVWNPIIFLGECGQGVARQPRGCEFARSQALRGTPRVGGQPAGRCTGGARLPACTACLRFLSTAALPCPCHADAGLHFIFHWTGLDHPPAHHGHGGNSTALNGTAALNATAAAAFNGTFNATAAAAANATARLLLR